MENQIKILAQALDVSNKQGVFTLQESATVFQAFQSVVMFINQCNPNKDELEIKDNVKVK